MAGAFCFILIQLVLLIDFAHSWNESWVEKMEEGNSRCWYAGKPNKKSIYSSFVFFWPENSVHFAGFVSMLRQELYFSGPLKNNVLMLGLGDIT